MCAGHTSVFSLLQISLCHGSLREFISVLSNEIDIEKYKYIKIYFIGFGVRGEIADIRYDQSAHLTKDP